jgi:putative spermidine/putrescine transport system substrate-binding protein
MNPSKLRPGRKLIGLLTVAQLLAACSTAATPAPTPTAAPATQAASPSAVALTGPLAVVSRGGPLGQHEREAVWDPFTARTGVEVVQVEESGGLPQAFRTQVESGKVQWDLVYAEIGWLDIMSKAGFLEKIDYSTFAPSAKGVVDRMDRSLVRDDAIAFNAITVNVGYDTRKFPDRASAPKTWKDFWDVAKFPGPRALPEDTSWVLEAALLADGVDPKSLYPIDEERAFKKLAEIKPHVVKWWTAGAQGPQLLADGEAAVVMTYAGRLETLMDQNAPIDYSWEQALYFPAWYIIPKGAPHKATANAALSFMFEPEVAKAISQRTRYALPEDSIFGGIKWHNAPPPVATMIQWGELNFWDKPSADGSGKTNRERISARFAEFIAN